MRILIYVTPRRALFWPTRDFSAAPEELDLGRYDVWTEAAKWLNKFDEAVLTVTDDDGYPASVRVATRSYDAATGELSLAPLEFLHAVEGPANLLCHSHDEKIWNLQMLNVKGTIEKRDTDWVFQTKSFEPPSKLAVLDFVRKGAGPPGSTSTDAALTPPEVNWAAIKEIQRRA